MIIGKLLNKGSRCLGSVCVCVCERIADPLKGRRKEKKKIDIMARETLYKRMSWSTGSGSISSTAERRAAFIRFRETPFPLSFPLYYVTATTFFFKAKMRVHFSSHARSLYYVFLIFQK